MLEDYQDYLRVRDLEQWNVDDTRSMQTRRALRQHRDSAYYRAAIRQRTAETTANIAITMIHQEDVLLYRLVERVKQDFLARGGIREQMSRARREYRKQQ